MMDSTTSPLVLTKIRVPAAPPRIVPRMRLVDCLTPPTGTSLVLVCAPAGYGKTTLLVEWAQTLLKNGTTVAWYTLDPSDDDPIPFSAYLIASLERVLRSHPELTQIAQLLRTTPEIELQRILPAIINTLISIDQECMLILDDYHLISAPAIHSAVTYLIEHAPEKLHIVIGSRSDPPLPLARLRARGQLLELRAANLRFTSDETEQFLNEVMRLDLSAQGVNALEERTEGWVTGLQLAALSLSGRADKERLIASISGNQRYLVEYLLEEVVHQQPEEVQSFLQLTSILERLCAPLCDALLGKASQSESILRWIEKANLFVVTLDDQGNWYRYHHLFRDFLQTQLTKTQPEQIPVLHRAACEWFAMNGLLREAAVHAFQVRDWEYAAAFVEQHSFTLILHSEISTIYAWCSSFPEEMMQSRPMLCILQGLALAYHFRRKNRDKVESRLRQADQLITTLDDQRMVRELVDLASVIRTFLAFAPDVTAEPQELLALARNMLSAYPEGDPGRFSGLLFSGYARLALHDLPAARQVLEMARQIALHEHLFFGIVESTFHLARLTHSQGKLRRAMEICQQGRADIQAILVHPEQELPALGCLDVAFGSILLEMNQLDEAERRLRYGLELMGAGMNPHYLMVAYLGLFRLYDILGHPLEAMKYLDRLEAAWPDLTFCTQGLRTELALRSAPEDSTVWTEAVTWLGSFPPTGDKPPFGIGPFAAMEAYYLAGLARAWIQVEIGNTQEARRSLELQLALSEKHGLTSRVIELSLLDALAARAEGDEQNAWASIERALLAGQPEGYIRIFDRGPALTKLLAEAARRGIRSEYAQQILAAVQRPATLNRQRAETDRPIPPRSVELLSEREHEVLRLIAQGATNEEIAEQLVITVGTVKSHINHIFGKLDSHHRTEAVARARGLGLLDI